MAKTRPVARKKAPVQASVSYGRCKIYVQGLDMNCPLCGVLVKSGERHTCSTLEKQ